MKHLLVIEYDPSSIDVESIADLQGICRDDELKHHQVIIAVDAPDVAWGVAFKAALDVPTTVLERSTDG